MITCRKTTEIVFFIPQIDLKADVLAASNPFFYSGDEWKKTRARITPALTVTKLRGYLPSILDVGDELVKYIKNKTEELETREVSGTNSLTLTHLVITT